MAPTNPSDVVQYSGPKNIPPGIMLAVDPGLATGWVIFNNGVLHDWGIERGLDAFSDLLVKFDDNMVRFDLVLYENFKLFKWLAVQQSGSEMETSQAIGMLRHWARQHAYPVEDQSPQILKIAQMWSKVNLNKNHKNSHHEAAFNHGFYWLVSHNMIKINTGNAKTPERL